MTLTFDLDDVVQRRAIRAAARALGFSVESHGPARFLVRIESADEAYRLGLESMKRWRAKVLVRPDR